MFFSILADVALDTVKILPFLYLTYLAMEYIEDKASPRFVEALKKTGKAGPLIGAAAGIVPQCGFSSAASSLFAGGVITGGSLLSVYLSTSDEMLPMLLSESVAIETIGHILLCKFLFGVIFGYASDFFSRFMRRKRPSKHIHDLCRQDKCRCEEGNIFLSALRHTGNIIFFIFLISLLIAVLVQRLGEDTLAGFFSGNAFPGILLSALIGLIPNCASSVLITQLYIDGILTDGQMIAGLLVGAGVGLLVLFRTNRRIKENMQILTALYVCGVLGGLIVQGAGITF